MCTPKAEGGMGFKDLKAFNLALLAKQGWRISQDTYSLAHRVLKAKYFPDSSFLEAQLGKNPSYTWRSLVAAIGVLKRGLRWNIGNGQRVRIWADKWVPIPNSFKVISPRPQNFEGELVESLLNREIGGWNTSVVKNCFLPHEAEAILSIPISNCLPDDALVWAWNKKGNFTVKSAYHVAHEWLMDGRSKGAGCEGSNPNKKKDFWKTIWGLKCPSKVKHFMWRACKNILPTNYCLCLRKVSKGDECGLCGLVESSGHALWDCWLADAVWKEAKISLPRTGHPHRDFIDVVWKLWEERKEGELELLACTAWCIWKNRNAVKFEGKCKNARRIVTEATTLVEEFSEKDGAPKQSTPQRTERWTPPSEGWYKVNVDGAVFNELGSCGIGIVIRNERGEIMGAMSKRMDLPLGALEVEAKAFEEGLLLAGDLGLKHIVLEGDAQVVTDALMGCSSPPTSIQMIIEGIQRLNCNGLVWKVSNVCRTSNMAAHRMARNAKCVNDSVIWVEDIPPIIEFQVIKDVTVLDHGPV